jgi:hypothetical protein
MTGPLSAKKPLYTLLWVQVLLAVGITDFLIHAIPTTVVVGQG